MAALLNTILRKQRQFDRWLPKRKKKPKSASTHWPDDPTGFKNSDTGRFYKPHHHNEQRFVYEDGPWRYGLARGGEGGGKSVAGIIKTLWRLKRGMSGAMVSPDFEHFKKSLWPEFRRWCPWDEVEPQHQVRAAKTWEPSKPFSLVFKNGAILLCGGIKEPISWEGPNLYFAYFDEARRKDDPGALKVLDGRARLTGASGEPPQVYITTTPKKHWLFDYFGPIKKNEEDEYEPFKKRSLSIVLTTAGNKANLSDDFDQLRGLSLTEAEKRVYLGGEWEELNESNPFLPSILWWDACQERAPRLDYRTSIVLAADAAVSGDCFALVGVSRHPARPDDSVMIRYARAWYPPKDGKIDYLDIEREIRRLCEDFNVIQIAYDPYQLHDMMTRLQRDGVGWTSEFNQQGERLEADKQLHDIIRDKRLAHDGDPTLRDHVANSDRKMDNEKKMRIIKRKKTLKIDLTVAMSMGTKRCLTLNL